MSTKSQLRKPVRQAVLLFTLSTVFTGTVYANQCGDVSQALTMLGDNYYHIDNPDSDARYGKSNLLILLEQSSIYNQLRDARFKDGTGKRTRCFGTEKNLRAEEITVELMDIFQQDKSHRKDSELAIHAFEFDKANRKTRRESIYLSSDDNVDVLATTDGKALHLNSRRRQQTKVGSYLRETAISAISTDTGIDIMQSTYVNGHLAEWFSWSLNASK